MKNLVTGADGFIGRHLVTALLGRGREVKAVVHQESRAAQFNREDVDVITGDLRDSIVVEEMFADCDCVYHLAGKTTKSSLSKREYYAHNVAGTINVARSASKAGVRRMVYASSIGVYGSTCDHSIDEETKPSPDSYYRESKLRGEQEVLRLHRESGLPVVIARIGSVYGPGSLSWLDLCRKIRGDSFRIVGTGENYQELVYVDDLVDGLCRCGETSGIEGRTYILKGPEPVRLNEMIRIFSGKSGAGTEITSVSTLPFWLYHQLGRFIYRSLGIQIPRARYYDLFFTDHIFTNSRARDQLGYRPKISIEDGIRRLVDWYRREGLLVG